MKKLFFKVAFVLVSFGVLNFTYDILKPMIIADSAVLQLQDSDQSYAQFKGVQGMFEYFFILYILPLAVFTKDIKKLMKPSKGEF